MPIEDKLGVQLDDSSNPKKRKQPVDPKCEHGRTQCYCFECGGSRMCPHGKQKSYCKDCGGSQICLHQKRKSCCIECGGSEICTHGKVRSVCIKCGSPAFCVHGKRKSGCRDCGGASICAHGRVKLYCNECGGSAMCKHRRVRARCKDCGGSAICIHNKVKILCRECGGSAICEHGVVKYGCKNCGGSRICAHGREKFTCRECGGSRICITCGSITEKRGTQCRTCCPIASKHARHSEKRLEWQLSTWAEEGKIPMYSTYDESISGIITAACNARRPDFFYDMGSWILVVENDERQHVSEDGRCNLVRVQDIANAVGTLPMYFIRYNPDGFRVSGKNKQVQLTEKHALLLQHIQEIIANPPTDNHVTIRYLFYNCNQCKTSRTCSFVHTDTFKTMVELCDYIESTFPLSCVGAKNSRPRPSASALHVKLA